MRLEAFQVPIHPAGNQRIKVAATRLFARDREQYKILKNVEGAVLQETTECRC